MSAPAKLGLAGRLAKLFIHWNLTTLLLVAAVGVGALAVWRLPREEEPQIVVPMADVFVRMPGASAKEIEARITTPLERSCGRCRAWSTSTPRRARASRT